MNTREPEDEAAVEVGEVQKYLQLFHIAYHNRFLHCLHFGAVHTYIVRDSKE